MTTLPRKLCINPQSLNYHKDAIKMVDKVFVDDVHLPHCYAYDMDAGWAMQVINGLWKPKVYGVVRATNQGHLKGLVEQSSMVGGILSATRKGMSEK